MKYNHTIQKITINHLDKFKDAVDKSTFLANYAKEKDKVKKIEMLRKASGRMDLIMTTNNLHVAEINFSNT